MKSALSQRLFLKAVLFELISSLWMKIKRFKYIKALTIHRICDKIK